MHRCLKTPEIITRITEECIDIIHSPHPSRARPLICNFVDVYRLALVCKTFLEPALDILWKSQYSLLPVLKCFPSDAWTVVPWEKDNRCKKYQLIRPLGIKDWGRFNYYGRRVKSITLENSDNMIMDSNLHQALFVSLDLQRRKGPLLKKLREITYNEWPSSKSIGPAISPLYIQLLAGPLITDVSLHFAIHDNSIWTENATALDIVRFKCTHVKSLRIGWPAAPSHIRKHVSSLFRGMVNLRDLVCDQIVLSPDAFSSLAAIPFLRKLRCSVTKNLSSSISSLPSHPFQVLEEVELVVVDISFATGLFRALKNIALRKIHIEVEVPPSSSSLHDFFQALVSLCIPAHVTYIHVLQLVDRSQDEFSDHHLDAHAIEPLFTLPNIENLLITPNLNMAHFTDSIVQRIVMAWPRICLLDFTTVHQLTSGVTLEGLTVFAKCRNLESLALSFITSPILDPWRNERPGKGFFCETLKSLHVGRSEIEDPQSVAAVLSDIFPCLESLESDDCIDDEQLQFWSDTFEAYKLCVKVRNQERAFSFSTKLEEVGEQEREFSFSTKLEGDNS